MFELISTHMLRQVGEQNKRFVFFLLYCCCTRHLVQSAILQLVLTQTLTQALSFNLANCGRMQQHLWISVIINRIQILHFALTNVGVSNLFSLM